MDCLLISVILLLSFSYCLGFPDDEVKQLPGLTRKSSFRHYSGYLTVEKTRHYHYWFVESQSNPEKDPLILWLNGGPGCSSLDGFWTENGPFRVNSDAKTVIEDPNSWNTLANVIYLESPVGVGYSYDSSGNLTNNDDKTADDNYHALLEFFKKFPQFSNHSFYITGESYAGVYIPMLALRIFRNKADINLKGVAIGNGALNFDMFFNSRVRIAYTHGLISSEQWNGLVKMCCECKNGGQVCNFANHTYPICNVAELIKAKVLSNGINPYNIYTDCSPTDYYSSGGHFEITLQTYFGIESDQIKDLVRGYSSKPGCVSKGYQHYINSAEVRKALHIPEQVKPWQQCSKVNYKRQYMSMKNEFKELIEKHKIQTFIVYNGDIDIVCDFLGDQQFVDELGYKLVEKYKKWSIGGRTAGFVKRYEGISFMTVRNAGHMVPTDQPEAALAIIKELIGITKID